MNRYHPDLINLKEIAENMGLSHSHVRDRISKESDFPDPVMATSAKHRFWKKSDIAEFLRKRAAKFKNKKH